MVELAARIAPNWTSAAGALDGILSYLGAPLPRHAIMGLTGHAWRLCLGTAGGVTALPSGVADYDHEAMTSRYARTGMAWERFSGDFRADAGGRDAAVRWATERLDAGRPVAGWDLRLHEWAVIYGYDEQRRGFLVDDVLTPEVGPFVAWNEWPSLVGRIEMVSPAGPSGAETSDVLEDSLATALECLGGRDGPGDQPRGTAALDAWAAALDGEGEVDRAGNAYTLAVLQAARLDGIAFLDDIAASIPGDEAADLHAASAAFRAEVKALAPLLTLFPFPSGGHGNIANAGLRRAAAMALRRAAGHERDAAAAIGRALGEA